MHIVLLGPSGLLGRALLRQLAGVSGERAAHVLVHRKPLPASGDFIRPFSGSMSALPHGLFPQEPHVVVHFATRQIDRGQEDFSTNLQGMECLAQAVNSHTRAILYASSYSVYGDGPQCEIDEDAPPRPQTALARSRLDCEMRLRRLSAEKNLTSIVLRSRFITGDEDTYFLPGLAKLMRMRIQPGDGGQRYSLIGADDYARVVIELAQQVLREHASPPLHSAYNIAYARPISFFELRHILREFVPIKPPLLSLPVAESWFGALEGIPHPGVRQMIQRLRLVGYDRFGVVRRLAARLRTPILFTDPQDVVFGAARRVFT